MAETIINIALVIITIYLLAGVIFSLVFVTKGIKQIDEGTHGTGIGFRLIILPGCIIFWPVLLKKWMKVNRK